MSARGQWNDDFSDGDFSRDPEWIGMEDRFEIYRTQARSWLRSRGLAKSDTIYLATPSTIAYGIWQFRLRFEGVNLSNFNGARVFVISSTNDLAGDVQGYYLQFGTNNSNEIRLFRVDGDQSRRRIEIGRWPEPVLSGTSGEFEIRLHRDADGRFDMYADGTHVLTVVDDTYSTSEYAGVWIKHTAAAAESYLFTDFLARPPSDDDDMPIDDEPSTPTISGFSADGRTVSLVYSAAMSTDICDADAYEFEPSAVISHASCATDREVMLTLSPWLEDGRYTVRARAIRDSEGTLHDRITGTLVVKRADDQPSPPQPVAVQAVRHALRDARAVRVEFSGGIEAASLPSAVVRLDAMLPSSIMLEADEHVVRIELPVVPEPGDRILTIDGLRAKSGYRIDTVLIASISRPPERRQIVINEVHYDPPDQSLEFFELYNRSDLSFDVASLDYSDDRIQKTPLASESILLGPGEYAVFVRDGQAFEAAFPGVAYIEPTTWHVLNNPGDAIILFAGDAVVDSVHFTSAWGGRHVSLERIDPDGPSVRANFGSSTDLHGATPGRRNSIFAQDHSRGLILRAVQKDAHTVVLHPSRALNTSARERININCPPAAIDGIQVHDEMVEIRMSGARPARCVGEGMLDAVDRAIDPFDLEVALIPLVGELFINEVMFDPLTDPHDGKPDQPFYVEIVSTSEYLLSLGHVALAGPVSETGTFTRIDHVRPEAGLAPGGFAVFSTEDGNLDHVDREGALASAFNGFNADGSTSILLPVRRSTLGMRRGGDPVRLIRSDSTELDAAILHPSMHHPALRQTRGRSLERRSTTAASSDPTNWASSTHAEGGTPGNPNSSAPSDSDVSRERVGLHLSNRVFGPEATDETNHVRIDYRLRASSSNVRARVYDSRGRLVRTIDHGSFSGTEGTLIWEGYDDDRRALPVGIYIVILDAVDIQAGVTEQYRDTVVLGRNLRR